MDDCEEDRLIFSDEGSKVILCPANYDREDVVGYSIIAAGTNTNFEFYTDSDWDFEDQGFRATFDTIPQSKLSHTVFTGIKYINAKPI